MLFRFRSIIVGYLFGIDSRRFGGQLFVKSPFFIILIFWAFALAQNGKIFRGDTFTEEDETRPQKNKWVAVGLSLLLPGSGEMYLGASKSGLPLMIADGGIWTFAAGFGVWGAWSESEYKSFAEKYGDVNVNGKDEEFFKLIALYDSRDTYNYYLLLTERRRSLLIPETPEWNWHWRSEEDQVKYYDLWTSSGRAWRNFRIVIGVAAVNRIISALNVLRIHRRGVPEWDVSLKAYPVEGERIGVSLTIGKQF